MSYALHLIWHPLNSPFEIDSVPKSTIRSHHTNIPFIVNINTGCTYVFDEHDTKPFGPSLTNTSVRTSLRIPSTIHHRVISTAAYKDWLYPSKRKTFSIYSFYNYCTVRYGTRNPYSIVEEYVRAAFMQRSCTLFIIHMLSIVHEWFFPNLNDR